MDMKVAQASRTNLLSGIEKTEELAYFRFLSKKYGFTVPNDWDKAKKGIDDTLNKASSLLPDATEGNLAVALEDTIVNSSAVFQVWQLQGGLTTKISSILNKLTESEFVNTFRSIYPNRVDEDYRGSEGAFLTEKYTYSNAIALVYSLINKKKSFDGEKINVNASHNFAIVYLPFNKNRIEIRLSTQLDRNKREYALKSVKIELLNLLGENKLKFQFPENINFYNAIESCFSDDKLGRAASATLSTDESASDAILKNLNNRNYCARTQNVTDTTDKGHVYTCRSVQIRWDLPNERKCQTELRIEPHKYKWEEGVCDQIQIKHPKSRFELDRLMDDAIKRAQ